MPLILILAALVLQTPAKPPAQTFFTTPLTPKEMTGKQAVVETSRGTFVIALRPDKAPNHVGYFIKLAREGAYAGTTFHRVVRYGIIQGGDPLTKDPTKAAQYGSGGLNMLRAEINDEPTTTGAVAAVLVPGRRDSGGAQFFVCANDQPGLQGQFTVFGRVVEGIDIVNEISAVAATNEVPNNRVVIKSVTIRDTPLPTKDPLIAATPAELARYRAVFESTKGEFELEFLADKAPETVRQFLKLARAGVFDGVAVHRIVPGFVLQTGALAFRDKPLTPAQYALVKNLAPEFSDVSHVMGVVSMARGEALDSATTSFFICIGDCAALDKQYTAFAKVVRGIDVVATIGNMPVEGEAPKEKIVITRVRVTDVK
jgi:cyclophilin family peptidyl-prolyl cis-trans isomerase